MARGVEYSELAIYYTPTHFMWGVKSGATPVHEISSPFRALETT